jgi:hypothetical protein
MGNSLADNILLNSFESQSHDLIIQGHYYLFVHSTMLNDTFRLFSGTIVMDAVSTVQRTLFEKIMRPRL